MTATSARDDGGLRLLATADLHYGTSAAGDRAVEALARAVCESDADALLVAGDIGVGAAGLEACLALFAPFRGRKLAVPGNHDVWVAREGESSWDLHEAAIPERLARHGFHALHLAPVTVGPVAFVGSMGWYDYSLGDASGIPAAAYRTKTYPGEPGPLWNDARFARFPWDDETLTALLAGRLAAQLAAVAAADAVVAVVHHLVDARQLPGPRWLVPERWRFANAFLGSAALGTVLRARAGVRLVVCGHVHRHSEVREEGGLRLLTVGSDYERKELLELTPGGGVTRRAFGRRG